MLAEGAQRRHYAAAVADVVAIAVVGLDVGIVAAAGAGLVGGEETGRARTYRQAAASLE